MSDGEGLVYEIHFDRPIGDPDNPRGSAQHYIGHTEDLYRRLAEHRGSSRTAAIMRAVNQAGIGWRVVRTWPGTRDTERAIKDLHSGRRLCPECTEHPLTGAGAVARAAAIRSEREAAVLAQCQAGDHAPRRVPDQWQPGPFTAGVRAGGEWAQQMRAAGRTAGQVEAAHRAARASAGPPTGRREAEQLRGYEASVQSEIDAMRRAERQQEPELEAG